MSRRCLRCSWYGQLPTPLPIVLRTRSKKGPPLSNVRSSVNTRHSRSEWQGTQARTGPRRTSTRSPRSDKDPANRRGSRIIGQA